MRKPKMVRFGGGWAECLSAEQHYERRNRVGLAMMPWLTAAQCRRLAAWLIRAAEWIEAKEGGR